MSREEAKRRTRMSVYSKDYSEREHSINAGDGAIKSVICAFVCVSECAYVCVFDDGSNRKMAED